MTKEKLVEIIKTLNIAAREGIIDDFNSTSYPRLAYWEFVWDPIEASGNIYDTKVSYQLSMLYQRPRDPKLLKLRNLLLENGVIVTFHHEYIAAEKHWHSYCAVEVIENI